MGWSTDSPADNPHSQLQNAHQQLTTVDGDTYNWSSSATLLLPPIRVGDRDIPINISLGQQCYQPSGIVSITWAHNANGSRLILSYRDGGFSHPDRGCVLTCYKAQKFLAPHSGSGPGQIKIAGQPEAILYYCACVLN